MVPKKDLRVPLAPQDVPSDSPLILQDTHKNKVLADALLLKVKSTHPVFSNEYSYRNGKVIKGRELSDKEVLNNYMNAKKKLSEVAVKELRPSPTALEDLTREQFGKKGLGDFEGKTFTIISGDGPAITGKIDILAKALGYSGTNIPKETLEEAQVTRILPVSSTGNSQYKFQIRDSDGNIKTAYVEDNSNRSQYFRTSNAVFKILNSGSDQGDYQDPITGHIVHVKNFYNPLSKEFQPVITISDPQTGATQEVTTEQLFESEKNALMGSGLVGTKLAVGKKDTP